LCINEVMCGEIWVSHGSESYGYKVTDVSNDRFHFIPKVIVLELFGPDDEDTTTWIRI
jgi:hypothetical protein